LQRCGEAMPHFRYRALTQNGEVVSGSISAGSATEVTSRIEYLGLVPIDMALDDVAARSSHLVSVFSQARKQDVTIFTRDLALLMRAGARLDDGLELLAKDLDVGKLRPVLAKVRAAVLAGESFADAIALHSALFPPVYVALVRVGELSGSLDHILETLATERSRAEALRRKIADALYYPSFVLLSAGAILIFFLMFVLPQFSSVLRDFNAKPDLFVGNLIAVSDLMRSHETELAALALAAVVGSWLLWRRASVRALVITHMARLPVISSVFEFHRTALFCRNLSILLGSGVTLSATLRILIDIMAATGKLNVWTTVADRVRHGGKLSDALTAAAALPPMAVRMLRIGEETGQVPALAARVAEFYEARLQRQLDRIVAIVGPAAIITISVVVGGLIVSVMTALLSVSQVVG
jgi:general secretion pathway protein F